MNDQTGSGEKVNAETSSEITPERKPTKPGYFVFVFLAILSIAALALSLHVYQQTQNFGENIEIVNKLEQQVISSGEKVDELSRRYDEIKTQLSTLENGKNLLQERIDSMSRTQGRNDLDWTLAEIEHLMIIATHKLELEGDVNTALAALETADDRLRDITDATVFKIRDQLTSDMNSLRSVNTVDIPGMALYMADIINRVEVLPLQEIEKSQQNTNSDVGEVAESSPPAWKRLLSTIWEEFRSLVIITKESEPGPLSLLPDQSYYLRQNMRLQLEAARLAILERDTGNLRVSIELVLGWLQKYFDVNDASISNIVASLEQMYTVTLQPDLPDISSSLETLRALIRERTDVEPEPAQTGD